MKHNFTLIKIFFITFANKHLQYFEFPQYLKGLKVLNIHKAATAVKLIFFPILTPYKQKQSP